jgi:hypothetical protein
MFKYGANWLLVAGAELRLEPLRLKAVDLDIRPRISLRIHQHGWGLSQGLTAQRLASTQSPCV